MEKGKSVLNIKFIGDTFKDINEIIDDETEHLKTVLIIYSKMADVYIKVFKSNQNIIFVSRETFGDIIIDDNHVVIIWKVLGHEIEFYFEEYWGLIELNIDTEGSDTTIKEIVHAFENYYNKKFTYEVTKTPEEDYFLFDLVIYDKHVE